MKNCAAARIGFVVYVFIRSSLLAGNASNNEPSKPQNYAEIKALFESYALAIDWDESQRASMKALRAKGDDATAALIAPFKEAPDERYRANVVNALASSEAKNKMASAELLAQQLPDKPEDWKSWWIVETIRFLTVADPETAVNISRKGLLAKGLEIQSASVKSLASVGTTEDLLRLDLFMVRWQKLTNPSGAPNDPETDIVSIAVIDAQEQISKRTALGE